MGLDIKAIGYLLAALALFGSGLYFGSTVEEAKWQKKEADRKDIELASIHDRLMENEAIKVQKEVEKQELKKGHANEIAKSRAASAAAPRLRISAEICDRFAGQAEADGAGGSDGRGAGTWLVSPAVDQDFRALELKVEEIFAGCRVAQEFLKRNGMAP